MMECGVEVAILYFWLGDLDERSCDRFLVVVVANASLKCQKGLLFVAIWHLQQASIVLQLAAPCLKLRQFGQIFLAFLQFPQRVVYLQSGQQYFAAELALFRIECRSQSGKSVCCQSLSLQKQRIGEQNLWIILFCPENKLVVLLGLFVLSLCFVELCPIHVQIQKIRIFVNACSQSCQGLAWHFQVFCCNRSK